MFVDEVEIELEAGKGGDGCVSFRREKYVPRGGPDGGDGGRGGNIVLRANENVGSLIHLSQQKRWKAANGVAGSGAKRHGAGAEDLLIDVPVGTIVIDQQHGFLLKDLATAGDEVAVCRGGKGGKGNTRFKTATNRAPRVATPGEEGERRHVRLELKMIADIGLVGKPNAGKSTLLSRVSAARPEIAPYPFTTKHPHLGIVAIDRDRSFVMADIPGLIEGAGKGVGLGHDFLRHIQRAGFLLHLVEPAPADGSDPWTNYETIRKELVDYDVALGERPEFLAITKADIPGAVEVRDLFSARLDKDVFLISAATGQGIPELIGMIAKHLTPKHDW
ncbi:MAG TPA: GTPase ObgE [Planctomycetaceae bacterium]|nr:GTPase ObgE [Planctomycetaceae bacterium]